MATEPMKKMNKSQVKKLDRLKRRQKEWAQHCTKFGSAWELANKKPGAVK